MRPKVEIRGDELIIVIALQQPPVLSSTKKTYVIATTHGTVPTEARHEGRRVSINLNAFVYPDRKARSE